MSVSIKRIVTTAPTVEPVTLAEAKTHLRIDNSNSDTEITAMISAARDAAEQYCNRYFARVSLKVIFDLFPVGSTALPFPLPDVESVGTISYLDEDGDSNTLTGSTYDADRQLIIYTDGFPEGSSVSVSCDVGPDNSASPADYVPPAVKHAILMMVGDLYDHRTSQMEINLYENKAVTAMLTPYRVEWGV